MFICLRCSVRTDLDLYVAPLSKKMPAWPKCHGNQLDVFHIAHVTTHPPTASVSNAPVASPNHQPQLPATSLTIAATHSTSTRPPCQTSTPTSGPPPKSSPPPPRKPPLKQQKTGPMSTPSSFPATPLTPSPPSSATRTPSDRSSPSRNPSKPRTRKNYSSGELKKRRYKSCRGSTRRWRTRGRSGRNRF